MNTEQLTDVLHQLRLGGMADALEIQLNQPNTYDELGFFERLEMLANAESTYRENRKISRLIKQAKLRINGSLNQIDYKNRQGLSKDTVAQLSGLDWVRAKRNLLIEGPTGTGKTFVACAMGMHCCERGTSVRYYRSSRLFDALTVAHGDGSFAKVLTQLSKVDVLIIDDWGLDSLTQTQRNDMLEIMEDRHGNSSTIITSQLPVTHWHEVIGDPTLADAILDRLLHNSHKIKLQGDSMRKAAMAIEPEQLPEGAP